MEVGGLTEGGPYTPDEVVLAFAVDYGTKNEGVRRHRRNLLFGDEDNDVLSGVNNLLGAGVAVASDGGKGGSVQIQPSSYHHRTVRTGGKGGSSSSGGKKPVGPPHRPVCAGYFGHSYTGSKISATNYIIVREWQCRRAGGVQTARVRSHPPNISGSGIKVVLNYGSVKCDCVRCKCGSGCQDLCLPEVGFCPDYPSVYHDGKVIDPAKSYLKTFGDKWAEKPADMKKYMTARYVADRRVRAPCDPSEAKHNNSPDIFDAFQQSECSGKEETNVVPLERDLFQNPFLKDVPENKEYRPPPLKGVNFPASRAMEVYFRVEGIPFERTQTDRVLVLTRDRADLPWQSLHISCTWDNKCV